jgi:Flp pilus assembly protein TadG
MPLPPSKRKVTQRGNSIIEFSLVIVFLLPLMFGVFSVGLSLTKSVQAAVIARDSGSMFMRYVDFSTSANKQLIVRIARGMGMTENGGNGTVILTQVMRIGAGQCIPTYPDTASCPNFNRTVVIKRIVVGNSALTTSVFGSPSSGIIQSDGSITPANYLANATVRADAFDPLMSTAPLSAGEFAFIAEAFFITPELDMPGYRTNTSVYQRSIF